MHKLSTVWTSQINESNAWREYPRPNMVRESYINLNGYWEYAFRKKGECLSEYDGHILVPFSPEAPLSGVNRRLMPNESLWYKRFFTVEPHQTGHRLLLHFGAVDQYARVFINDVPAGSHTGGYLPFTFDITDLVQTGANSLVVMVRDVTDTSYHARGKQRLKPGGMFYTPQSGIWQTVWLEYVPDTYIGSYRLTPLYDEGSIELSLVMAGSDAQRATNVHMVIFDNGSAAAEADFNSAESAVIALPDFKSWSPESPFLYTFRLQAGSDCIDGYFAMRKFSVEKDKYGIPRLFLNNKPYFHNGVLDQGYWPDGLYTAPCDEALVYDISTMKRLGFNMLRKHAKIEPLRWYYHCDRLGMLVWQDMVNGGSDYNMWFVTYFPTLFPKLSQKIRDNCYSLLSRSSKKGRNEYYADMSATISFLYNIPCVAVWVTFNEGWGQFDALEAERRLRLEDNTRTIDSASGWFDQNGGDLKSHHIYFTPFRFKAERERAVVLSEFGGYAYGVKEHMCCDKIYGYRKYTSPKLLTHNYRLLFEKKILPNIPNSLSAAIYTQLSDIEEEINGLLTYDRKVLKINEGTVHKLNIQMCYTEQD